jgi:hypothetical protein
MEETSTIKKCRSCGSEGTGNYCNKCGQPLTIKRITLRGMVHEIFRFFTHFDKGFGYTLKQLIVAPGHMQRTYIEGMRGIHQKPFSMFFICATISALARYWLLTAFFNYYHVDHLNDTAEAIYFREYMVFFNIGLIPLYTLITYFFFYKFGYNYAEQAVVLLYTLSVFFLAGPFLFLLKFIWPYWDTAYIEFPLYLIYFIITQVNIYNRVSRWKVMFISLLAMSVSFIINQLAENMFLKMI